MQVRTSASAFAAGGTAEALFDRVADPAAAAEFFRGAGPIPAIAAVRLLTAEPISVGSRREVELADGTLVPEEVIEFERPRWHRYRVLEFHPPLSRIVRGGEGTWSFAAEAGGARITWTYQYEAKSFWTWPLTALFAKLLMRRAMQRAVDRIAAFVS